MFNQEQLKAVNHALEYYIEDDLLREKAVEDIEILLSKIKC